MGEHLPCKQGVESSNLLVSMPCAYERAGEHLENSTLKPILKYRKIGKTSEEAAREQPKKNPRDQPCRHARRKEGGEARTLRCGEKRSCEKEHREDALALRADERRDKLRKASGRSKYPSIRRYLNGETRLEGLQPPHAECIGMRGEPGELKHLSSRRKRKKHRFRE